MGPAAVRRAAPERRGERADRAGGASGARGCGAMVQVRSRPVLRVVFDVVSVSASCCVFDNCNCLKVNSCVFFFF